MTAETPAPSDPNANRFTFLELARSAAPALRANKPDYYFDFYDQRFRDVRRHALKILEVGVQRGGSTILFAKYFPNARVLGIDIEEPPPEFYEAVRCSAELSDRVKVEIVSQDDESGLRHAINSFFGDAQLDLVVDDASHLYRETRSTFNTVFGSHVKPGGTYVIEDWGCGYWPLWHDGHPDGRHGLPRLMKELLDLLSLADRTVLWGNQRTLPVESEMPSPISRAFFERSIAAFVRSEAEMPSSSLMWGDDSDDAEAIDAVSPAPEISQVVASQPETAGSVTQDLGLRELLRQLPAAAYKAAARRLVRARHR